MDVMRVWGRFVHLLFNSTGLLCMQSGHARLAYMHCQKLGTQGQGTKLAYRKLL